MKPKVTTPDQPMNAIARIKEEKALIDDADFTDNFRVNKDVLIELAPRDKSADPEFQEISSPWPRKSSPLIIPPS